jgi:hypothetical protein
MADVLLILRIYRFDVFYLFDPAQTPFETKPLTWLIIASWYGPGRKPIRVPGVFGIALTGIV